MLALFILSCCSSVDGTLAFCAALIAGYFDWLIICGILGVSSAGLAAKNGKQSWVVYNPPKSGNEGYESVDWNCNGKIDYWEK